MNRPAAERVDELKSAQADAQAEIFLAVEVLERGGLIGLPTETVYGLGADAGNPVAVAGIFAAKQRPADHPLIVHLHDIAQISAWARDIPPLACQLADAFWPGPLTMILRRAAHVLDAVTGGLDTIALRIPDHPLALDLIGRFGRGIAAPSANRHGRVSPTSADHVRDELGNAVDLVLDGGPCTVGIESTIVDLSSGTLRMLRPGAITMDDLRDAVGFSVEPYTNSAVRSPGMLSSHYAPRARMILVASEQVSQTLERWSARGRRVGLLAAQPPPIGCDGVVWLDLGQSVEEQAQQLFAKLREADHLGLDALIAVLPDDAGLGHALRDRLQRAAGPGADAGRLAEPDQGSPS